MSHVRKVYLPLWLAWFSHLFLVPMWLFVTYKSFVAEGREESIAEWLIATFVMAGVSAMVLLMGYRKLPAYIIEDEVKEK